MKNGLTKTEINPLEMCNPVGFDANLVKSHWYASIPM